MKKIVGLLFLFWQIAAIAQVTYPTNGAKEIRNKHYAFTNATIYKDYQTKLEKASLIIKDGKVVTVSPSAFIPADAIEVDCSGKTIYPAFVEIISNYGLPEAKPAGEGRRYATQLVSDKKGAYYWNEAIKPETLAYELFASDSEKAKKLRAIGYGAVVSHQTDGIVRGSGTLVNLNDKSENENILKDQVASFYSFRKGVTKQNYPSSLMGAIALLEQTYLDGEWYKNNGHKEERNISLEYWNQQQDLPAVFLTSNWQEILRADRLGDANNVQYIIKGGGDEYKRLEELKASNASLIVPVKYPKPYDVEDPFAAHYVALKDMKHWELAPYNLARLDEANIEFALTTDGLEKAGDIMSGLKTAIKKGLKKETALKALTYAPAKMLRIDNWVGSLKDGSSANFLITSGDIFEEASILENWVQGDQYLIKQENTKELKGVYDLKLLDLRQNYKLEVKGKPASPEMNIVVNDTTKIKVKSSIQGKRITLHFTPQDAQQKIRLNGMMEGDVWQGKGQDLEGNWIDWQVDNRQELSKEEEKKEGENSKEETANLDETKDGTKEDKIGEVTYPFLPYGWTKEPKQKTVLFKNATVWTNTDDGILEETDVLIRDGRIVSVGKNLDGGSGETIDATGKHLTCGIIDEHSHIAISRGVNEGTQASSAEVSIGNVINSDDINIYRQLAGGVTTAQLLHGSANPIGGQSAIIKFRWGASPEEMKFENADKFIKFALGENVKHSNWGNNGTIRFPQTRLGVEQVFVDFFTQAKEYEEAKRNNPSKVRRNIELETILEIMNKERFITCHSYVQSEITMLMRVAEQFGFNINTFTHILEGYKIADKMKEHGVFASTFSDWWMYKFEVNDAIPHNAAILTDVGVVTAINSDDAEMGRRLNNEAAKGVKYGGMTEEEAWKMVTLNPAKILHLENRVGTIESGKDADVVLWSDNPLSNYSKAEQTYVDGRCYWDIEKDKEMRKLIQAERNRLIQKMLKAKEGGAETQKPSMPKHKHYHCDDIEDEGN